MGNFSAIALGNGVPPLTTGNDFARSAVWVVGRSLADSKRFISNIKCQGTLYSQQEILSSIKYIVLIYNVILYRTVPP